MTLAPAPRKRPWLRWLFWIGGSLLGLFLLCAAVLYFLIPKEKIIAFAVPKVEQALQRPVHLEDAGISLWPPFGVYLAGLRVEDPKASDDMLRIEHLRAQLAWRPLLSGELRFSSLSVKGLAFHYEQFDDSTSSLTDLLAGPSSTLPIMVERLEFEDLRLTLADRRDTSALILPEVSAGLTLDAVTLDFESHLTLPRVETRRGDSVVVYDGPLELSVTGKARRNPFGLTVDELKGSLQEVPLSGRLTLDRPTSGTTLAAQFTMGPADVKEVQNLLPPARRQMLAAYELGAASRCRSRRTVRSQN